MDFQAQKKTILELYAEIEMAKPSNITSVMKKYYAEHVIWRGFHPFNELRGYKQVATKFWIPLMKSFKNMQRRMDIFLAGENEISGSINNRDINKIKTIFFITLF